MSTIEKWAERVYAESDFGRSVATSLSGIFGLSIYLIVRDWVIAAFISIIIFPVVRIVATSVHTRLTRDLDRHAKRQNAEHTFSALSDEEKDVVLEFVGAGGCVITWSHMNKLAVAGPAIESLLQRELLSTSMTADGMRETFVLDPNLFDVGVSHAKAISAF